MRRRYTRYWRTTQRQKRAPKKVWLFLSGSSLQIISASQRAFESLRPFMRNRANTPKQRPSSSVLWRLLRRNSVPTISRQRRYSTRWDCWLTSLAFIRELWITCKRVWRSTRNQWDGKARQLPLCSTRWGGFTTNRETMTKVWKPVNGALPSWKKFSELTTSQWP